ncbi:MAG: D-alanine-D-alanine ligase [Acidobacteriaceae bacterium]|jgi:D-alanine-D-alanine ligase|nr:D-alanine-D-alanine ligase [Acidobacteriaceae bacterium]
MPRKLRVGIVFGGRSGEHEVSLRSAASVLAAIDKRKYDVVPIGIAKTGHWLLADEAQHMLAGGTTVTATSIAKTRSAHPSALVPAAHPAGLLHVPAAAKEQSQAQALGVDVLFPVLHGTFGEDGTIQGLFELAGKAYVGSGVLGSAAGMDKDVMKRLFAAAGLPIVEHVTLLRGAWQKSPRKAIAEIEASLRYPLFVKPANLGSSVGISKVHDRSELAPAIVLAASYDRKIIIEQGVGGKATKNKPAERARELEVAVLGNDDPKASVVGEIVPAKEFYDYEAKYESDASLPIIPARLSKAQTKDVREMAIAAFHACDCSGLARVDFLLEPEGRTGKPGRLYLNEINTMPGFTSISMYPKLWEASGLKYSDLIDRLIELALERRAERDDTQYSR